MNSKPKKPRILVIVGPTATGKSDLAVLLAKKFNGEVVSADSRQVYKGLNIGTGKITRHEMKGVWHHLLDVADPKRRFSVVRYVRLARQAISRIQATGKVPIICGGTGFYIQALVDGIVLPDVPPNKVLRAQLGELNPSELLTRLKKADPIRFATIEKHNIRRVIRAIEIAETLGAVPPLTRSESYETLFFGLTLPSMELKERIHRRLITRLRAGMIAEVKRLHKNGLSWKRMEELGLEYRYLARFIQGKISKEEMIRQLNTKIWHYARRQMTWFRRDKRIVWFLPNQKGEIFDNVLSAMLVYCQTNENS
jgi:tRNA dimethylallyltransferase